MTDIAPPTPVKPGWQTTEFWMKLAAIALTALFASGIIPTTGTAASVAAIAATMLGALGYTVSRSLVKASGAALLLVVALAGGATSLTACAAASSAASSAKAAIVDCVHADQAPIEALLVQLGADAVTFALRGAVDWSALEAEAETQGVVVGGCAFSQFAHGKPSSTPGVAVSALSTPPAPPDPAAAALERFRAAHGGVKWQTGAGVL
jgi:hypothetical protein